MAQLRTLLDTYATNFRFTLYPRTVLESFNEPARVVDDFVTQVAVIDTDTHLTPEGKQAARRKAGEGALGALGGDWCGNRCSTRRW